MFPSLKISNGDAFGQFCFTKILELFIKVKPYTISKRRADFVNYQKEYLIFYLKSRIIDESRFAFLYRVDMDIRSIIHTYQRPLVSIACRMLGNLDEARDAVQETFIRFWKRNAQIEGDPFHLLSRILINHCIDLLRQKRRRTILSLEWISGLTTSENPEHNLDHKNLKSEIMKSADRLKPKQKAVFLLRDVEEYSIKETADILGDSENQVRVNLHLARKNMRKWLRPFLKE
jgi:RNA polymerase sigma-70 factor (ECF subfamily)